MANVKRPYEFKLDSYRFYRQGNSPTRSFELAGEVHNVPLSGCMTKKSNASSYMSDDIRRVLRGKLANGDPETVCYFQLHKLDPAHI